MTKPHLKDFHEKQDILLTQTWFENEYKKRHFLINTDLNPLENIFDFFERNIIYADQNSDELMNFFDNVFLMYKFNNIAEVPSKYNSHFYKFLCEVDCYHRKEYNIPFYNLMMPCHAIDKLKKSNENNFSAKPIIPVFYEKKDFIKGYLYRAIFANTVNQNLELDQIEKDFLKTEFKIAIQSGDNRNIALLSSIVNCLNGKELEKNDALSLIEEMNKLISKEIRSNSLESRIRGLLHYDFKLASIAYEVPYKIENFMIFQNDFFEKNFKKPYKENDKKIFRDELKHATICIQNKQIQPIRNKGTALKIPKIQIPNHITPYFDIFKDFYVTLGKL